MTSAEVALGAFTAFNVVRVLAYLPQIMKIARDAHGAVAVSITTWAMFALSHASTVVYALLVANDTTLAGVFALNAAFCTVIVGLTVKQRRRFKRAQEPAARTADVEAAVHCLTQPRRSRVRFRHPGAA